MPAHFFKKRIYQKPLIIFIAIFCLNAIVALLNFQFALLAQQKTSFIQITDTHISSNPVTHRALEQVLLSIKQLNDKPAFVINTGDLTDFGSEIEFQHYKTIIDKSGLNFYHALGNHDVRWCNIGKKGFIKWLGPLYHSFCHKGIQFFILDSGLLLEQYGHFSKAQLNWLREELNKIGTEKPIILAAHHPLFLEKNYVDNEFELLKLLDGYNVVLFICGHGHQFRHWQTNGIHFLMTKAVKSGASGYRLFETDGDSVWIYTRDLNEQAATLDFSCALNRVRKTPAFTIDEPKSNSIFNKNLPITIRSQEISQIDVSLDGINWCTLELNHGQFKGDLDIEHFSAGNHFLKLKFSCKECQPWRHQIPIQIERNEAKLVSKFQTDDAILASPVIADDMLWFGSLDGNLYALDAETMDLKWLFHTDGPIVTTPLLREDSILVTSGDGFCYALNKKDGKEIWKTKAGEAIFSSPIYADGAIIFGSSDSSLYALRSRDGKLLWTYKTDGYIKARPIMFDDKVYIGSWDRYFYCVSKQNGALIWKQKISDNRYFPAATSNPTVFDNKVIVASHDHVVHAFRASDGKLFWQHQTNDKHKPGYSSPNCADNKIYFGSLTGHLFALGAQSGEETWTVALPDSFNPDPIFDSSPAIINSDMIVGSIGGTVFCVDKDAGRLKWSVKLSDDYLFSSPAIWKNHVYIGSCDGSLYKVSMPK